VTSKPQQEFSIYTALRCLDLQMQLMRRDVWSADTYVRRLSAAGAITNRLLSCAFQENAERIRLQSENGATPMGDARAPTN